MSEPAGQRETTRRGPARERLADAAFCLSLSNLCFLQSWFDLLFREDHDYLNQWPLTRAALAALAVNLLGFATVLWLLGHGVRAAHRRVLTLAAHAGVWLLLAQAADLIRINLLDAAWSQVPPAARVGLAALGLLLLGAAARWPARINGVVRVGVLALFPLALLTLGRLAWTGFTLEPPPRDRPPPPLSAAPSPAQPRVVWVIFDELDYRVLAETRPAGLALPEFDRLFGESLSATNARPPSGSTMVSLPALLTGLALSNAEPAGASDLRLARADTGETVLWSAAPNVFGAARALGLNTALAGWFHPYPRVLGGDLHHAVWFPLWRRDGARGRMFAEALLNQQRALWPGLQTRAEHLWHTQALAAEAARVLSRREFSLVFLHLPVPHKPGIYRRATGRFDRLHFSLREGYLDNLALADRILGELRRVIESGDAPPTWLLVSSDHWWRDVAALDGKLDHRVPFILRPPQTGRGAQYGASFNTVLSSRLVLAILRGEVVDATSAAAWLDRHRAPDAGERK
jgi:hypothetical protein